ncbi:glycoside hydrolase family 88 protein [Phlebiopsis gigantea 11061_1 CR5-6]|uniref:Glycoside hydrolase family 88 protein n=1 Tax=Phlebiopsis gigantea (strain 11061_1 CR5-6) TaxID=745531 RepID=A0A0C3NDK3_PHLG1|nr:glycoside hydrolase family 88 protein [Phlebiopsis gigantea 11061_1 CR5-6]
MPSALASLLLLALPCARAADLALPAELFSPLVAQKILATAQSAQSPPKYPQYTDRAEGAWEYFAPDTWTSGFFPATLYALHARATLCPSAGLNGTDWVALGQTWAAAEVPSETHTGVGHDVGFLSFPFALELEIDPSNQTAIAAVNNFATELANRFDPVVGCTRSWDTADPTDFQVIIDNMMNLEVLFVSANLTGNQTLRDIATSHADKTAVNHVRPDGGSFHVVDYNATTGSVISRHTSQGYADNSTWSRGQSWGVYGFANMFKHTGNISYLETSRRMAAYFLDNLPDDGIVPWDFNAPLVPPRPADSSAAMVVANGLLLLSQGELSLSPPNKTGSDYYTSAAIQIVANMTALAWRPEWQSLLANGTVNNPQLNNLTGIVYGDYYFVRAGNELVSLGIATCNGSLTGTLPATPTASSTPSSAAPSASDRAASGAGRVAEAALGVAFAFAFAGTLLL